MDFILDPYVIAVPRAPVSPDRLANYAASLEAWAISIRSTHHKFWLSTSIVQALIDCGQYPFECNLKHLMRFDSFLSAYDIFRACQRQIIEPPYVDEKLQNGSYAYDLAELIVLPEELEERLDDDVAHALKETLALMAISDVLHNSEFARNLLVATSSLAHPASDVSIDFETLGEATEDLISVSADWRLVSHPKQLDEIESLLGFWQDTPRALKWTFEQLQLCGAIKKGSPYPNIKPGAEFNNSIESNNPERNPGLLEAAFRNAVLALLQVPGFERHKYAKDPDRRTNKHHRLLHGITKEHITRADGSTAWRVHLSGNHRLHYWLLPDGSAELSIITSDQHEDFHIA